MKPKYYSALAFGAFLMSQTALAQTQFNEVQYTPNSTVFKLNAPTKPLLRIYNAGKGGKVEKKMKMKKTANNVWETTVSGDLKGKFYTFDIGKGETPGVFAKAVGINGQIGRAHV